eukprot:735270-Amphidinium_carterae.2
MEPLRGVSTMGADQAKQNNRSAAHHGGGGHGWHRDEGTKTESTDPGGGGPTQEGWTHGTRRNHGGRRRARPEDVHMCNLTREGARPRLQKLLAAAPALSTP